MWGSMFSPGSFKQVGAEGTEPEASRGRIRWTASPIQERKKRGIPVPLLGKLDSMRLAAKCHNSFLLRLDHDNILGRENVRLLESKRQLNEIYKQMWTRKKHNNILNITRTIWGSEWAHVGMGNSLLIANAQSTAKVISHGRQVQLLSDCSLYITQWLVTSLT